MDETNPVIGIDLGTTYWEVSWIGSDGWPKFLKNKGGSYRSESAIWLEDNQQPVFGPQAKRMYPVYPQQVILYSKPEWDDPDAKFSLPDRKLSCLQVCTLLYEHIKKQVEAFLGGEVDKVVITVPAYFHDQGRQVMKEGAEKAGFTVEKILREPAAAALGFAINDPLKAEETILVYDLGGGTFDVSVVKACKENDRPHFEILANSGDTKLGGRDFDRIMLEEIFIKAFQDEYGVNPTKDPQVKAKWLQDAEQVKEELSQSPKASVLLQGEGKSLPFNVTREDFYPLIQPSINQTIDKIKHLLKELSLSKEEIDRLVLVGGSTRIPAVADQVADFLALEPVKGVDPDMAVVVGAALMAGAKANQVIRDESGRRISLLESDVKDVTSHALGVKAVDPDTEKEYNHVLIPAKEKLRAVGKQVFHPTKDDASLVKITILEGESEDLRECRVLQEGYELHISNPRAASHVEVEVELAVSKDGLIEIIARTEDGDEIHEEFRNPHVVNTYT